MQKNQFVNFTQGFKLLFAVAVVSFFFTGCSQTIPKPAEIQSQLLTKNVDAEICFTEPVDSFRKQQIFSYELFKEVMEEENPVISPVSAYLALCMTGNGASGETAEEFKALLGEDMLKVPYELMDQLSFETENTQIIPANSLWLDDQMTPDPLFLHNIDKYFDAEIYRTKLSAEQAMKDMNLWINEKTEGLIPTMLKSPLSEDVRMVLFNTLYFKSNWRTPFSPHTTKELEFTTEDGNIISTQMMQCREEDQLYIFSENAAGVILPYADEEFVFLALMPSGNISVREMYETMTWEQVEEWLSLEEKTLCNLRLPKFDITFEKELNESLNNLGLVRAFDSQEADFTKLGSTDSGRNLYISLVKQKSVIIVDEKGTEAAAATQVEVSKECAVEYPEPPVNIYFDRPFFYMIIDTVNQVPLFMGIMDCPEPL